MKSKTWVLGDIHGAYKALKQVIEKAGIGQYDQLIFLGDYVDGWPESYQVIDYLMNLSRHYSCTFIRGNHDIWCGSWLAENVADQAWLENKGSSTITSYAGIGQEEKACTPFFLRVSKTIIWMKKTGCSSMQDLQL